MQDCSGFLQIGSQIISYANKDNAVVVVFGVSGVFQVSTIK